MFHLLSHKVLCYPYDIPTIQELLALSSLSHHLGLRQSEEKTQHVHESV